MMDSQILLHQAGAAVAAINDAKTPYEKHHARADGFKALGELERAVTSDAALAVFKKTTPQSAYGVWKGDPVRDRPVFMTGPTGMKIVSEITLPDGSKATANAAGQIAVQIKHVPAMTARGFLRANAVMTEITTTAPDPARNI